jgi:ketosteroid isomerase-like protein
MSPWTRSDPHGLAHAKTNLELLPMKKPLLCVLGLLVAALIHPSHAQTDAAASLANQVRETERAFAKTMADRNHAAFASFLADDTVFMGEPATLRGKQAVVAAWKRFYDGAQAPFSWDPERVEVLDSGALAYSSGPVRDPQGKRVGTFNSVWRREQGGAWKIVFDKGCPACDCK